MSRRYVSLVKGDPSTADIPVICISNIDEGEHDPAGLVAMLEEALVGVSCQPMPGSEEIT